MAVVAGKVALITGGAGGIGLAMVKALLKNGLKAVAIVDVSEETGKAVIDELAESVGDGRAIFIKADVTDKKQLEEAFEKAVKTYSQLDIVINNAGMGDEFDWEKTIAVNLVAVIHGTYLAQTKYLPEYKSGEEGIIVNTASVLGLKPIQSAPVYCASKHGVVSIGQSLGGDEFYKKYQVRVLTICPGLVNTNILKTAKRILPVLVPDDLKILKPEREEPEVVGEALIKILNEGKNGSIWVTEFSNPPYEVSIPHWNQIKVV